MKASEFARIGSMAAGDGDGQQAVLLVDASGRILFCSALRSPLWMLLAVERLHVDTDGHVVYCTGLQPGLSERLADQLIGLDVDLLLPGIGFRRRVREWGAADRRERSACAQATRGDVHVAATIRRLPSPSPLFAVEVSLCASGGDHTAGLPALAHALERSDDAVLLTDIDGVIQHVNPAFERMTGYARVETIGRTPALLNSGHQSREFYRALWDTLRAGAEYRGTFVNRRKSGAIFHEEKTIRPLFDAHGSITHYLAVGRDVSGRVQRMEELTHAATHDPLTDLPNRGLFHDRLVQALRHAARTGEAFAVAIADIDRFKPINDTYGHATGDAVICAIAARLQGCVREADTVARIGGDEFGLLLRDQHDAAGAARVLAKVVRAFELPLRIGPRELAVTISVGASLAPADGQDLQSLLDRADRAMYGAKRAGGNGYRIGDAPPPPRTAGVMRGAGAIAITWLQPTTASVS